MRRRIDGRAGLPALCLRAASVLVILTFGAASVSAQEGTATDASALAIENVTILPMTADIALENHTVLVDGSLIRAVGPADSMDLPEGAMRVDGHGRFLLPGLVDVHVHLFGRGELGWYLAHGVTSVRNMWGWQLHLDLRRDVAAGRVRGPRIFTTGPLVDGDPPRLRGSTAIDDPRKVADVVARQAAAGYDAIKVYDRLDAPTYGAIVLEAARNGLPVVGHVPAAVGLFGVLAARQHSIEHLRGFPAAVMRVNDGETSWSSNLDAVALARITESARDAGTWIVPTLIVLEQAELDAREVQAFLDQPMIDRLPESIRPYCTAVASDPARDLPAEERRRRSANRMLVVRALHRAGVPILVGSDTGNPLVVPGAALHDELALLERAGIPRFDLLAAATREAARFLGVLHEQGTVQPGKRADMVLVEDDPRNDLSILRRPNAVITAGQLNDRSALDGLIGQ